MGVKLPHTEWALIPRGENGSPDCCIFDFTNLYAARVAARVMVRKGQPLLCTIVGDSLLQPFWPEGTGCARGFLSAMDCGWLIRDWMLGKKNPIKMLVEREMTRSILNQTTDGNLIQAFKEFSLDPKTRYKVIPKKFDQERIYRYYDSDNPEEVDFLWIVGIIVLVDSLLVKLFRDHLVPCFRIERELFERLDEISIRGLVQN